MGTLLPLLIRRSSIPFLLTAISLRRLSCVRMLPSKQSVASCQQRTLTTTNAPHKVQDVYIAMGSNIGDRALAMNTAFQELSKMGSMCTTSFLYETTPMYHLNQDNFLNAVCMLQTDMPALQLLRELQRIEQSMGRTATFRNGPRVIDLDMLLYGEEHVGTEELSVPHPRIAERAFVLRPLLDIVPETFTIPHASRESVLHMYDRLPEQDRREIRRVMPVRNHVTGKTRFLSFDASKTPLIMGILNVTPDSFSDGGTYGTDLQRTVDQALRLVREGAGVLDVGGESTRPGAQTVPAEEELRRVLPAIQAIRAAGCEALLSVDTRKAEVAAAAVQAGADMVNDVSAGRFDPAMLDTVGRLGVPYVAMHMRGVPETMQRPQHLDYRAPAAACATLSSSSSDGGSSGLTGTAAEDNVVSVVAQELGAQLREVDRRLPRWLQIVDPGIGFAKGYEENVALLRPAALRGLRRAWGDRELLVGCSRKKFLSKIIQDGDSTGTGATEAAGKEAAMTSSAVATDAPSLQDRDLATAAVSCVAWQGGASILRVHDVKSTKIACDTFVALSR